MAKTTPLGRLGIKPTAFAARLGISRGYAHDIITGRRPPSAELALAIEREFGVNATLLSKTVAAVRQAAA